jgi:fatty acid desaturase
MATVEAPAVEAERAEFSLRHARDLIGDLFDHRADIYWTDLVLTLVVGYGAATIYLRSPVFSLVNVVSFLIAGFALFRAGSFIHEITHLRRGQMTTFEVVWNLVCGIPMLMPSFFYENHIDHHNTHRYGTIRDGEYLPLGVGSRWQLLGFWLQVPLLPIYIFLRLLLAPISFLHPRLRQWTLEHTSSFVINFRHRLDIPESAPRRAWAAMEVACCLRAGAMLAVVAIGVHSWTRLVQLYCLALMTLGLNYVRNMVAHHYRNTGAEMSYLAQLEDSVNITGNLFTELFFPLGLRYHALHHLFPALPYHNLGTAHRRLVAKLPAGSPYHQTVYPSYFSVMRELWKGDESVPRQTTQETAAA